MSDRQQQRAEAFAIDLGIGMNQARTVLREFARALAERLEPVTAGQLSEQQRLLLDHGARGEAALAEALQARLDCSHSDAQRFTRAAAFHFLDGADCDAAETGRRPAACLLDALRSARDWLSAGERYEIEQALWKNMEQRAHALGNSAMLTSKDGRSQLYQQAMRELKDGVGSPPGPSGTRTGEPHGFPLPASTLRRGPW